MIEFKRGQRKDTETSERMVYPSKCLRYKIEKHTCKYDHRVRWLALYRSEYGWWRIVKTKTGKAFRTRRAAIRALEKLKL